MPKQMTKNDKDAPKNDEDSDEDGESQFQNWDVVEVKKKLFVMQDRNLIIVVLK